jgi:hypothetical protein
VGPVRGNHELKATARDEGGPLHQDRLSREGVWDGSRKRTTAPNASESSSRLPGLGECAYQHDTLYLTVAGK